MAASPERQQDVETSKARRASAARCGVSGSRSGGACDGTSLPGTPHRSPTRVLFGAGLAGHHGGASVERAFGERVNERALAREWCCFDGQLKRTDGAISLCRFFYQVKRCNRGLIDSTRHCRFEFAGVVFNVV